LAGDRTRGSRLIYLFAGVLTVTAVVVTLPLTILPMLNLMGWNLDAAALHDQILGCRHHARRHHRVEHLQREGRSVVNNTGVFFEIFGLVVFAVVMLIVHRHQPISVVTNTGGLHLGFRFVLSPRCS